MRSMTGYSEIKKEYESYNYSIRISSLNNSGLKLRFNIPYFIEPLKIEFEKAIREKIRRGSITIFIKFNWKLLPETPLINFENLKFVKSLIEEAKKKAKIKGKVTFKELFLFKDYIINSQAQDFDPESPLFINIKHNLLNDFNLTISRLIEYKIQEGEKLKKLFINYSENIIENIKKIESMVEPEREKLFINIKEKLNLILKDINDIDEKRIIEEAAFYALRFDIEEELKRLFIHTKSLLDFINSDSIIKGTKLDFLCQEILREANTIASKSNSIDIKNITIQIKEIVTQMREQLRNIE